MRQAAIVFALVLAIGVTVRLIDIGQGPPHRKDVERDLASSNHHIGFRTLAYRVWEGVPYVLYYIPREGRNKIYVLAPVRNWIGGLGRWELPEARDAAYLSAPFTESTDAPASLFTGPCPSRDRQGCAGETVAFGQVNASEIMVLELDLGQTRRRYPVSYPGFAVRLGDGRVDPSDYRWLDAQDRVVWSKDQALPSAPTLRPAPLS